MTFSLFLFHPIVKFSFGRLNLKHFILFIVCFYFCLACVYAQCVCVFVCSAQPLSRIPSLVYVCCVYLLGSAPLACPD